MSVSNKINILIVDKCVAQQHAVKRILQDTGFTNIKCTTSSNEAIEIISNNAELQKPIELLICNDATDESDDIQIYTLIKEQGSEMPHILLLCQDPEKDKIVSAAQAGIKNILLRPFSKQSLINELSKVFG